MYSVGEEVLDVCSGEVLTGESGVIQSPNFPDNYPKGLWRTGSSSCSLSLTGLSDALVKLTFETFELEESAGCINDFFLYGNAKSDSGSSRLCGNMTGETRVLRVDASGQLDLFFNTNGNISMTGFQINYQGEHPLFKLWRYVALLDCGSLSAILLSL